MSSNKKPIDIGFEENMGLEPKEIEEVRVIAQKFYDAGYSGGHQGFSWIAAFLHWVYSCGHELTFLENKPTNKIRPNKAPLH